MILGGSQGARSINYSMPNVVQKLSLKMDIEIMHQTGEYDYVKICEMYKDAILCGDLQNVDPNDLKIKIE